VGIAPGAQFWSTIMAARGAGVARWLTSSRLSAPAYRNDLWMRMTVRQIIPSLHSICVEQRAYDGQVAVRSSKRIVRER
jgi:hypothetical protein